MLVVRALSSETLGGVLSTVKVALLTSETLPTLSVARTSTVYVPVVVLMANVQAASSWVATCQAPLWPAPVIRYSTRATPEVWSVAAIAITWPCTCPM